MSPAHQAMQAPAQGQLRLTGTLLRDAELRHTTGPQSRAILVAEVCTGKGQPHLVQQDLGHEPASHFAAQAKARLLKRGTGVTVYCRGAEARLDHGRAVLRCLDVTDLIPNALPAHAGAQGD
jgi:hypothetical protein